MAAWLHGRGHSVGCFPPTYVFLGSSPVHLLVRASAVGCQPGFQTGSHNEITFCGCVRKPGAQTCGGSFAQSKLSPSYRISSA